MAGIFDKIFKKEIVIDEERLRLKSIISTERSQLDVRLISAVAAKGEGNLSNYSKEALYVDLNEPHSLAKEFQLLQLYSSSYKEVKGEGFYLKSDIKIATDSSVLIAPFILFPLVQNAIWNGYTSQEKHPIRIRGGLVGNTLKLEVSNRVNHYIENQEDNEIISFFKARLEYIYAQKHSLIINSNSNIFKATLYLDLS